MPKDKNVPICAYLAAKKCERNHRDSKTPSPRRTTASNPSPSEQRKICGNEGHKKDMPVFNSGSPSFDDIDDLLSKDRGYQSYAQENTEPLGDMPAPRSLRLIGPHLLAADAVTLVHDPLIAAFPAAGFARTASMTRVPAGTRMPGPMTDRATNAPGSTTASSMTIEDTTVAPAVKAVREMTL